MNLLQHHRWTNSGAATQVAAPLPLAERPEGLRMSGESGHAKAAFRRLLAASAILLAGAAQAALPPGTAITNSATASFGVAGVPVTVTGSSTVVTSSTTPATVQLLSYAQAAQGLPAGSVSNVYVAASQCSNNGT